MRGVIKFLLTLIVGIGLIWLGFWWYAEGRLQTGFADWAEKQATQGVKISYDSIHRGTSVLDAAVTVDNLTLTLPPAQNGAQATISLPTVTLRIHALNPLVFHIDLPNKITADFGNFALVCNTGSIALAEALNPDTLFTRDADPSRGGDFSASNIDFLASGSLLMLHIDSISSHAERNQNAGPGDTALLSKTVFDGLVVSPLLTRLASIPFDGKLTHLALTAKFSGPVPPNLTQTLSQLGMQPNDLAAQQKLIMPIIHDWAAQGGNGAAELNLIIGPSTIDAAASVKFDANLQPNGTADLTANHLEEFTAALTQSYPALQDDIAQAEARFSQYIGNTEQGGQTLTIHLAYGTPGIVINGQKLGDLPVIDWNAAENPPPPPLQAPGDGSGAAGSGAAGEGAAGEGSANSAKP